MPMSESKSESKSGANGPIQSQSPPSSRPGQGRGRIEVSPTAIASIAYDVVLSCYGVVGVADKDLATGLVNTLSRDSRRGIKVYIRDGQIIINVYVVIEYGTRIAAVAQSVMNVVKFSVERALGVPVAEVNVFVTGVRISNID
ncbi:MAG TPA: Asp23/Gls24 family envelope stress response protein [Chloroflexi bacterium]|nr:Asp23/Gls24 family envelope stress response protein [Chloroflexota bacterium]